VHPTPCHSGEACPGAGRGPESRGTPPVTCVVYMTIAGTRVPLARLLGDMLYRNDMGLVRRGFEHKKETGGLDSGLRRNDIVGAVVRPSPE
ncbi:MAG TPA: hypothetical protein VJA25_00470, partial [Dehalococcoidia bacterium]|nr:hypothetical protein [Dehalococcoidia bacterium]